MSGRRNRSRDGISLVEILLCAAIMVTVLAGLFRLFIYCSELSEMSRNVTFALAAAEDKMEEIRNHDFNEIVTDYSTGGTPGPSFSLAQLTGMGIITIDSSNTRLLKIRIAVSWQNQNGRVIGEDRNLDGVFDIGGGEDSDGDGILDAKVVLESYVARL